MKKKLKIKTAKNKYGKEHVQWGKVWYRSKLERVHAIWLESELRAKRITKFDYEKRYNLEVLGKKVCAIEPDFTVYLPDGRIQVHEIKSPATRTREWAIKMKLFKILYPFIQYLVNPKKII